MGWVSWSLLASIAFAILGTYLWLDQLGRFPFNYFLPTAKEHTWQLIIISLICISYMILLVDNIFAHRAKRALERLKITLPLIDAWLEIEYGGFFTVVIECKNSVPINFRWRIGTMSKDNQNGSFRVHTSSGKEFEAFYPSLNTGENDLYIDSRTRNFPVSYATTISGTYNVILVVDYKSIFFEEMRYKDDLEGQIIRKYELVDYSLKEVQSD